MMPCPCTTCLNHIEHKVEEVQFHLFKYEIDLSYTKWDKHGEKDEQATTAQIPVNATTEFVDDTDFDMDFGSEIPTDGPATVEMVNATKESFDEDDLAKFQELLLDAEKPLYKGCPDFTKLSAIVKLLNLKGKYGASDKFFTELLGLLKKMLPAGNEMVEKTYQAKKLMRMMGSGYKKIHVCSNNCILYWKDNKELTVCPTCGISRWKVDNKTHKVYENIPAKVMWYFPIIPRLQRLFKLESISKDLRWHATRRITDGVLRHPADSHAWRTIDEKFPEIAKDLRNLRLGISADGVDINSGTRHHSVWPVLSVIYNLPPWLCMKRKFIMLSVLILGYTGNDIDVFLEPLVDDLHTFFETGVDTYDASTKENFNLRVVVLWTINDYPTLGTLCGCPYSGFIGCVVCGKHTHCVRLSASSKQSYAGHRRYLLYNGPFRRQKKAFNGQKEFQLAPNPLTGEQIYNEVQHIENKWGKGKRANNKTSENQEDTRDRGGKIQKQNSRKTTKDEDSSNQVNKAYWKKFNIWYRKLRKTKDGMNARLDLAELGIKPELFARQEEDKTTLPLASYTLTNAKKDIFCETLSNIRVIKGHVRKRNRPDGCIAEETIAEETIEFFSEYHKTMKTIGIPSDKHVTGENEDGKPLSAGKSSKVSGEVFQKAHLYVIKNTDEIVPYIERHKQVLKTKNPSKRIALQENEHSKYFAKWLREEIFTYPKKLLPQEKAFYYGVLQEIWVLNYRFRQIPLFKYDWVNHKAGGVKCDPNLGYTLVDLNSLGHKDDLFILASQARQVFYVKDQIDKKLSIVFRTPTKNYKDTYDEVDEEFSTVIYEHNDNILPRVN
ncbi:putative transposon, En/Spm-like protein [Tanacetum coccineum]